MNEHASDFPWHINSPLNFFKIILDKLSFSCLEKVNIFAVSTVLYCAMSIHVTNPWLFFCLLHMLLQHANRNSSAILFSQEVISKLGSLDIGNIVRLKPKMSKNSPN